MADLFADIFQDSATAKDDAQSAPDQVHRNWKPPGNLLNSYSHDGENFEIWCCSLLDERCKDIFKSAQILVPLFIEGGTCQSLDDQPWTIERWKVFFL